MKNGYEGYRKNIGKHLPTTVPSSLLSHPKFMMNGWLQDLNKIVMFNNMTS